MTLPTNLTADVHRRIRWGAVLAVVAALVVVLGVCVSLGAWQWSRGVAGTQVVVEKSPVPLADVLAPASPAGPGVGAAVSVDGAFADTDVALVAGGREIDGVPAVVVVRAWTVSADATGTGAPATLPVIVGWTPAGEVDALPAAPATTSLVGYLRGAEGASAAVTDPAPEGTFWSTTLSPAVFAQHWDSPLYSALLVADRPEDGLRAIPEPEPAHDLNFRSIIYALEWWLFGAFFLFVGVRWIRDNGRVPCDTQAPAEEGTP